MQARMLIAFVLVFGVIFATPYFYKLLAPPAPAKKPVVEFAKKPEAATSAEAPPAPAPAVTSAAPLNRRSRPPKKKAP